MFDAEPDFVDSLTPEGMRQALHDYERERLDLERRLGIARKGIEDMKVVSEMGDCADGECQAAWTMTKCKRLLSQLGGK